MLLNYYSNVAPLVTIDLVMHLMLQPNNNSNNNSNNNDNNSNKIITVKIIIMIIITMMMIVVIIVPCVFISIIMSLNLQDIINETTTPIIT